MLALWIGALIPPVHRVPICLLEQHCDSSYYGVSIRWSLDVTQYSNAFVYPAIYWQIVSRHFAKLWEKGCVVVLSLRLSPRWYNNTTRARIEYQLTDIAFSPPCWVMDRYGQSIYIPPTQHNLHRVNKTCVTTAVIEAIVGMGMKSSLCILTVWTKWHHMRTFTLKSSIKSLVRREVIKEFSLRSVPSKFVLSLK